MTKANTDNELNLQNTNNNLNNINHNNNNNLNDINNDLSLNSLNLNDAKSHKSQTYNKPKSSSSSSTSYNHRMYRNRTSYQNKNTNSNNKKYSSQKLNIDFSEINKENFEVEKELSLENDKFFVIKSFSSQDVYNSIIHKIWCSTENGNIKLNNAYKEAKETVNGNVYLFFSINGSGYFCGVAKMTSEVDFQWQPDANLWSHSTKWKGKFSVKWIYVKNVPNRQLSYIKLENNENKPVTHSRDCQLVPSVNGVHVMKIIHYYHHYSSILEEYIDNYEP